MQIICLDAEFADNEELLELSIFDLSGGEIYHEYYRPERIRNWRTDIHHITPEMVSGKAPFREVRNVVQKLVDGAFVLTGFAVDNDLRVLSRSGLSGLEDKRVIDVKDMFWYLEGNPQGMSPFSVPSLIACANALGFDFGEDTAHSASADTEATLKCFKLLYSRFGGGEDITEASVDRFIEQIKEAKARFVEESAKGSIKVYRHKDCYKLNFGRKTDVDEKCVLFEVMVADRYKAEYELKKLLKKKEVPDKWNVYKLTPQLLDKVRNYSNEYDAEESAWCKKVLRNLSRLSL